MIIQAASTRLDYCLLRDSDHCYVRKLGHIFLIFCTILFWFKFCCSFLSYEIQYFLREFTKSSPPQYLLWYMYFSFLVRYAFRKPKKTNFFSSLGADITHQHIHFWVLTVSLLWEYLVLGQCYSCILQNIYVLLLKNAVVCNSEKKSFLEVVFGLN